MGLISYHIFQKNEPHISRGTENNHKLLLNTYLANQNVHFPRRNSTSRKSFYISILPILKCNDAKG